jgi:hypothetical protein
MIPNWLTTIRLGIFTSSSASTVPRRTTARVSVAPVSQARPPKRSFAQAARKYAAITPNCVMRSAQPPRSVSVGSPCRARPAVGSTANATSSPNRSWSTLP